jgi:hypothetical protein
MSVSSAERITAAVFSGIDPWSTFLLIALLAIISTMTLFASMVIFPPHRLAYRLSQRAFRRAAKRAGLWIDRAPWSILDASPPPSKQQIRQIVHVYHAWPIPGGHAWDYDIWPEAGGVYLITLDTGAELVLPDARENDDVLAYLGFSVEEIGARSISRSVPLPKMFHAYLLLVLGFDLAIAVSTAVTACQCLIR